MVSLHSLCAEGTCAGLGKSLWLFCSIFVSSPVGWSLEICRHPFQPGLPSLLLSNFLPNRKITDGSVDKGA